MQYVAGSCSKQSLVNINVWAKMQLKNVGIHIWSTSNNLVCSSVLSVRYSDNIICHQINAKCWRGCRCIAGREGERHRETLTLIKYFTNTVSISTTHITCCSLPLPKVLVQNKGLLPKIMERLYMEAQDGLKTIDPPLFLNIFFYFLLV